MSASQELERAATAYAFRRRENGQAGQQRPSNNSLSESHRKPAAACPAIPRIRIKQSLRAKGNCLPRTNQSTAGFRLASGCPAWNGAGSRAGRRQSRKPRLKAKRRGTELIVTEKPHGEMGRSCWFGNCQEGG